MVDNSVIRILGLVIVMVTFWFLFIFWLGWFVNKNKRKGKK